MSIFDYDGPAYISAFADIIERIEHIKDNENDASRKEKKLLNSFYNQLNSSRSVSRSVSKSLSKSTSKKSTRKNRNKISRKKKTLKRLN
jgi:hypothetical protein